MKSKQLLLIPHKTNQRFFGGSLMAGRRKSPRPLNTKEPIHFVLRSQFAHGTRSFRSLRNSKAIEAIINKAASKYRIKIYRKAIQSNHIHLIIKVPSKYAYKCFISVISGKIASFIMNFMSFKEFMLHLALTEKHERGEGYTKPYKGQAFWEFRPFSRIIYWGKDYINSCNYLLRNTLEALGFIAYKPRKINYAYKPRAKNYAYEKIKKKTDGRRTAERKIETRL